MFTERGMLFPHLEALSYRKSIRGKSVAFAKCKGAIIKKNLDFKVSTVLSSRFTTYRLVYLRSSHLFKQPRLSF